MGEIKATISSPLPLSFLNEMIISAIKLHSHLYNTYNNAYYFIIVIIVIVTPYNFVRCKNYSMILCEICLLCIASTSFWHYANFKFWLNNIHTFW